MKGKIKCNISNFKEQLIRLQFKIKLVNKANKKDQWLKCIEVGAEQFKIEINNLRILFRFLNKNHTKILARRLMEVKVNNLQILIKLGYLVSKESDSNCFLIKSKNKILFYYNFLTNIGIIYILFLHNN